MASTITIEKPAIPRWTVYLKAVTRLDRPGWSAFAWRAVGPCGEKIEPMGALVHGSEARATLVAAGEIMRFLPIGAPLHYVSDFRSFWGALEEGWLDNLWRPDGFRNKPDKDRDRWASLSETWLERRVAPTAGPPATPEERAKIGVLKAHAAGVCKPVPELPEEVILEEPSEEADSLRKAAMLHDPW
jgi:hypothetical protein